MTSCDEPTDKFAINCTSSLGPATSEDIEAFASKLTNVAREAFDA